MRSTPVKLRESLGFRAGGNFQCFALYISHSLRTMFASHCRVGTQDECASPIVNLAYGKYFILLVIYLQDNQKPSPQLLFSSR